MAQQVIGVKNAEQSGIKFPYVPSYGANDIKQLRRQYGISQAILAKALNTTTAAVAHWEHGIRRPSGPSSKLLYLLDKKGLSVLR